MNKEIGRWASADRIARAQEALKWIKNNKQYQRKHWRLKYEEAMLAIVCWNTGEAGRDAALSAALHAYKKVMQWYRPNRAQLCVEVIQRRALNIFRSQQS